VHDDPMPHDRQTPARRDRLEPGRRPVASGSAAVLSDACSTAGKVPTGMQAAMHAACEGVALDPATADRVACECSCH
jgi:hypothetical protein